MTPFDETKHRSIRDLPRDVALAFAIVLLLILVSAFSPAQAATYADPVQVFAQHEARMASRHPERIHFRGYHYDGSVGGHKFVHITGIQVRAWIGKGINNPCWYIATIGHTVKTGSCRGNG